MHTRSSREVTVLCRDLYMVCRNDECGGSYSAQLSIVTTIHPSALPNAAVKLPASPRFHPPVAANDPAPNNPG